MGVPGLFAWLRRKYPLIVESCTASTDQEYEYGQVESDCDNLYVDFNHIAHACTHPGWRDTPYQSELECFLEMEQYLDRLFNLVRPQRLMMVAIDGVAPQAKISQQRTRRFMSAYTEDVRRKLEAEVRREMEGEAGGAVHIPALPDFDSNVITPGTAFMARMAQMLRSFFEQKLACDVNWRHVQVILSDANEPGEGEHKIMRFIRQQRTQASYDPNTRHVVYGQDADLNLLGLLTHEPHFSILREAAPLESIVEESGVDTQDTAWSPAAQQPLHYLRVSVLREYLKWEFADLIGLPPQGNPNAYLSEQEPDGAEGEDGGAGGQDQGGKKFEFERMAEDFVLLTFMVGT
ncbi:hypothetical protein WJX72_009218 [[Myrmecia] bisecta]|uniref:Xrn1 N-terminal domain-containing protein n=1 Tax=[Myrmecia] bisecta TaxID=41462 RepID=A0AAW1QST3_9CHLO